MQAKLAVLQNVLCNFQISAPFKYYFSNEHPSFERKGALIRGRQSLNISLQRGGGTNLMEVLL